MSRAPWRTSVSFVFCVFASAGAAQVSEFRDADYGYTLAVPAFAKPAEGQAVARLFVSAPPDGGFASNINVSVQRLKTTRDAYLELSEAQFRAAGLRIRSKENRSVSGRPAILLDYEGTMDGHALRWLALAVVLSDRVILATCTATAASFEKVEPEFRKSLGSLKLSP